MVETWLSMPVGEDLLFDRSLLLGGALGELSSMKIRKVDEKRCMVSGLRLEVSLFRKKRFILDEKFQLQILPYFIYTN